MPPRTKAAPAAADSPAEGEHGTISTKQMRQLHALLRDHGITGDKAVHDYIATALTEQGAEPVASRSDLTATQAAHLIADLQEAEVAHTTTDARLQQLRAGFPNDEVGKLPRSICKACSDDRSGTCQRHPQKSRCAECGNYHSAGTMHIDYVGHADVTARLLEVDPLWSWRPMTPEELQGIPPAFRDAGLWIMLTVLGHTRPGFGDAEGKRGGNAVKEAIGDALRNGAMRFGVALELWAKGDRAWAHAEKDGAEHAHPDQPQPREQQASQRQQQPPPAPYAGPTTAELLLLIDEHAQRAGVTYEQITAKWRERNGGLTLDALDSLPPQQLAELENQIATYLLNNPPTTTPGA